MDDQAEVRTPMGTARIVAMPDPAAFLSSFSSKRRDASRMPETPNKRSRSSTRGRATTALHMLSPSPAHPGLMERITLQSRKSYFDSSFVKLHMVGRGSSADVYKVCTKVDNAVFAVKILARESGTKRDFLYREVFALHDVMNSPYCLHLYEAWEEDGIMFIRTEYCPNGTLQDLLDSTDRFHDAQIWECFADLALGLSALHSHDKAHLDYKPSNIFIGEDNHFKLGDFGLTVSVNSNVSLEREGDPIYLAPEVLNMIDRPTDSDLRSADIFALGLVALQLCCPQASLPSTGIEWNRLRRGDLSYYDLSSAPAELVPLIQQMLSPDPRDRPTITHLLNHPRMQTIVQRRKNEPNLPALNWDAQKMRSHYEGLVHNSRVSQLAHSSSPPSSPCTSPVLERFTSEDDEMRFTMSLAPGSDDWNGSDDVARKLF